MCGIFGYALRSEPRIPVQRLQSLTDLLAHRGPDGSGVWTSAKDGSTWQVGFGHRRLAIIDLTAGGSQPMVHADRWVLSLNGEIYNYLELRRELEALGYGFKSNSDTEVLLIAWVAWGEAALGRLRGMFAFSLWDDVEKTLVLVRDPFGKKPLFLAEPQDGIVFASEIAPIVQSGLVAAELDSASVRDYLLSRYVPGPHTFYKPVKKLPPGHLAVWRDGRLDVRRYYTPPTMADRPVTVRKFEDATRLFRAKLEESIRLRLRSDAPFGVFLSGGLDSSSIAALMARQLSQPIKTFSVGFHEAEYSELRYAREIASLVSAEHHELIIDWRIVRDRIPDAIRFRGAPLSEPADIPMLELSRAAAGSVKMVLTGEGADELLAGYPKYRAEPWLDAFQRSSPDGVKRMLRAAAGLLGDRGRRLQILARAATEPDFQTRMLGWFAAMEPALRDDLLAGRGERRALDEFPFSSRSASAIRRMQHFDQTSYLPDNLLERADRMMMAAAIEGRMPFMDVALAETVAGFDESFYAQGRGGKRVLRAAMAGVLPAETLHRKKVGFRVPVGVWFRTSMRSYVTDLLLAPDARIAGMLDRQCVARVLAEHEDGRKNHESAIWTLINLEEFLRGSAISV
ncbi:MAG: asparagine synthase (glutamine-hydrolyzing) [Rhizomicrobium sp.]